MSRPAAIHRSVTVVARSTAGSVRPVSDCPVERSVHVGGGVVVPADDGGTLGPVEVVCPVAGSSEQVVGEGDFADLEVLVQLQAVASVGPDGAEDDESDLDPGLDGADQSRFGDLAECVEDVRYVIADGFDGFDGEAPFEQGESVRDDPGIGSSRE